VLPVTFSAPGDSYFPSVEDCLRDGVYLMLRADDVNRRAYSFDADDPAMGVRISSEVERVDNNHRLLLPQQIVAVGFNSIRFQLELTNTGTQRITINIGFYEASNSEFLDVDLETPPVTVLSKMARVKEILFRGTLYKLGMESNNGRVVDPYNSPLNEDGTYDETKIRELNRLLPEVVYAPPRAIALRKPTSEEDWLDPVRDLGVLYSLSATYVIDMQDRENMTLGGFGE
jgi:hypothetical protein